MGQVELKSTVCANAYHFIAESETIVSSFKLLSRIARVPWFHSRVDHVYRKKSKTCGIPPDALVN